MTLTVPGGGSLQAAVVDELGRRIATGGLPPGSVLSPDALTQELGVSRTVVREALRTLETLGMTYARPRIGTIVRAADDWDLLDARVIAWRSASPDATAQLADLLLLREAVEPMIAAQAARQADGVQTTRLGELCDRLDAALAAADTVGFAAADAAFHRLLVEAAGSPVLRQLAQTLHATLESRYRSDLPVFGAGAGRAVARHRELAQAIGRRDADEAAAIAAGLARQARSDLRALT
ncbi:MAG: FadR family transcriptional regulator [Propionibacteriaceae bacterium]|nr:FadR family transcriptional regulator [Propionibacteriaceae bacterium]